MLSMTLTSIVFNKYYRFFEFWVFVVNFIILYICLIIDHFHWFLKKVFFFVENFFILKLLLSSFYTFRYAAVFFF